MKDLVNETIKQLNNYKLEEMSNLVKRKTGLPVNIWVDDIGIMEKLNTMTPE